MSDEKLTPRVGDRVLAKSGGKTYAVHVVSIGDGGRYARLRFDHGTEAGGFLLSDLVVVDREPVEWPDGWSIEPNYILGPLAYHEETNISVSKDMLEAILATGPDMLARWDELVGGGE